MRVNKNSGVTRRLWCRYLYDGNNFSKLEKQSWDAVISSGWYCMSGRGEKLKEFICLDALVLL